jgi:transposase
MSKAKQKPVRSDAEFKAEAINLFLAQNKPATEVAKGLGIEPHKLRAWVRAAQSSSSGNKVSQTVLDELAKVKKDNKSLKMEIEILKKAATYFAKNLS